MNNYKTLLNGEIFSLLYSEVNIFDIRKFSLRCKIIVKEVAKFYPRCPKRMQN